jgi:uncharacterized membrane protein YcfT
MSIINIKLDEEIKRKTREHTRIAAIKVKKELIKSLIAAMFFISTLAWRDAVNMTIDSYYPLEKDAITLKFLYAMALTIVAVLCSVFILKEKTD